ncbi:MAG TPA: hypothetical protein PK777_14615, partial [Thermoguttaceae bacterium]|nr:hypothetical protein [Thermoguttaceae bacterium]
MSGNRSFSPGKRALFFQRTPSFKGRPSRPEKAWVFLLVGIGAFLGLNLPALGQSSDCTAECSSAAQAQPSWMFQPARFSHAPGTDQRLVQYQAPPPAVVPGDPTYQESGYRHKRSGISVGGSFDYRHVVETWGAGESIRPYGEWLY